MTAEPLNVEVGDVNDSAGEPANDIRAELAEAEAAEAEALAEAARARARADAVRGGEAGAKRRWQKTAALVLAALLTGLGVALTGLMVWQHGQAVAQRAGDQRFVAAAREGVTALLSIDYTRAKADVQRVLDLSTGTFHDDFQRSADDFVKTALDSKVVTRGTINAAALDTADSDRAVVMVVATSQVTNSNGANDDPRPFRMSVTVTCNEDPCKMSDVEFVP